VYNRSASTGTNTSVSKLSTMVDGEATEHRKGNGKREDDREVDYNGYVR